MAKKGPFSDAWSGFKGVAGDVWGMLSGKAEAPQVDPTMYQLDTAASNPYVQQQAAQAQSTANLYGNQLGNIGLQQQRQAGDFAANQYGLGQGFADQAQQQSQGVMAQGDAMQQRALGQADYSQALGQSTVSRGNQLFDQGQGIIGGAGAVQGRQGVGLDLGGLSRATTQADQARAQQMAAAGQLGTNAAALGQFAQQGPGPSVAEAQLNEALNRNMAQNVALARSGSGWGSSSTALRGAVDANARAQQQAAGQAATLRAQESDMNRARQLQALGMQTGAIGAQGQLLGGMRGQDVAGGSLGLQAATTQAQLSDAQRARNDAQQLGLLGAGGNLLGQGQGYLGQGNAFLGTGLQAQNLGNQAFLGAQGLGADVRNAGAGQQLGFNQAGQQAQQFNTTAQQALTGQQAGLQFGAQSMGQDLASQQLQAQLAQEQLRINPQTQASIASAQGGSQLMGGLLSAGALLAMSDERQKTNIRPLGEVSLFELPAYEYEYKDKRWGKGKHIGPMAQDLENTEAKGAVVDTPDGKMVDTRRLTLANTAGLSVLHGKIKDLQRELFRARGKAA